MIQKQCIVCVKTKPISNFYKRSDNGKYRNTCKDCQNKQAVANKKQK